MPSFRVDESHLITTFVQDVCYGIYITTLFLAVKALIWDGNAWRASINWVSLTVAVIMSLLSTTAVSFALCENLEAFLRNPDLQANGQEKVFVAGFRMSIAGVATVFAQTLLANGYLTYHCYLTYNRRWKLVLVPAFLRLCITGCTSAILGLSVQSSEYPSLTSQRLWPLVVSHVVVTAVQGLITIGMVVFRLWKIHGQTIRARKTKLIFLRGVIRIIVGSGSLCTSTAFLTLLTTVRGDNADYVTCSVFLQMTGVIFNLMIVRYHSPSDRTTTAVSLMELSNPVSWSPVPISEHLVSSLEEGGTSRTSNELLQGASILVNDAITPDY